MARLIVKREDLTRTVDRILRELDVRDLTITAPPIEKVMGQLLKDGTIS